MKKNIGNVLALYPTPAVVVGTEVNGKVNWLLVAHVGIIGHDQIMLSLFKKHYTNEGVKQTGKVSVNMVNEAMLERADYVGCTSGAKADKSDVFVYHMGEAGTPVINESPLVMECEVVDNYETDTFDNFICKIKSAGDGVRGGGQLRDGHLRQLHLQDNEHLCGRGLPERKGQARL